MTNNTQHNRKQNNSKQNNNKRKNNPVKPAEAVSNDSRGMFALRIIISLAVCLVLFLCVLGVLGAAGDAIKSLLFGIFGLGGAVLPFLAAFIIIFYQVASRKKIRNTKGIIIALIVLFVFLCSFMQLVFRGADVRTPQDAFVECYNQFKGGGFVGGLFAYVFVAAFGLTGAYIINTLVFLIIIFIFFGKKIISFIGKRMEISRKNAKIKREQERERRKKLALENREKEKRQRELRERRQLEIEREKEILKNAGANEDDLSDIETEPMEDIEPVKENVPKVNRRDNKVRGIDFDFVMTGIEPDSEKKADETELIKESVNEMMETSTVEKVSKVSLTPLNELSGDFEPSIEIEPVLKSEPGKELEPVREPDPEPETEILPEPEPEPEQIPEPEPIEPEPIEPEPIEPEPILIPVTQYIKEVEEGTYNAMGANPSEPVAVEEQVMEEIVSTDWEPAVEPVVEPVVEPAIEPVIEPVTQPELLPKETPVEESVDDKEKPYVFPPISLLTPIRNQGNEDNTQTNTEVGQKLVNTLKNFGVDVEIAQISSGPAVTRFEIIPPPGVKVSKITNLSDDIMLNLAAKDIRIEAPIPGKSAVGIEVPNKNVKMVTLRELIESNEFKNSVSNIAFCAGMDIGGNTVISDIAKMPHVLIAGATGSGKSVCINTIIMSILYKADPNDVKFIMIDPKVVELSVYNGIPHLMVPVVSDPKKAAAALAWAVHEMNERYQKFAELGVRDMAGYNKRIEKGIEGDENRHKRLPQIVVIVDELADLMMVSSSEVEESICRLAQLARACGIHLVIATQRPSVNVITGLIKANMPSRIAFAVTSGVDSRTILDMNGAEKLLGKGDMLYFPQGLPKPIRVQGAFVSDDEVFEVVNFIKQNNPASTDTEIQKKIEESFVSSDKTQSTTIDNSSYEEQRDAYFESAGRFIIEKEKASIGLLQRNFKIGFNRAARIMDQLGEAGVVGPEEGTKPRKILVSIDEFEDILKRDL